MGTNNSDVINNVIIDGPWVKDTDGETLFGDEPFVTVEASALPNLMVALGVYKSTTQARNAGRIGPIPTGWTEQFKASKKRPLFIWNPTEDGFYA